MSVGLRKIKNDQKRAAKKIKVTADPEEENSFYSKKSGSVKSSSDFAKIYRPIKGRSSDLTHIDRLDPNRKKKIIGWVIFGLVVLLAASLAGFYFFSYHQGKFSGQAVNLSAEIPDSLASGGVAVISIRISNGEDLDLNNVQLSLQYPDGFKFNSSNPVPENSANNTWSIGSIKRGQAATIKLIGQIFGEIGSEKQFKAILSYSPGNFTTEFNKEFVFSAKLDKSIFNLDFDYPTNVVSGKLGSYSVSLKNNSDKDAAKVQLKLIFPEDFDLDSITPNSTENNNIWEFENLPSGQTENIKWTGSIQAEQGAMREIKAEVGYVDKSGLYHKQLEKSFIVVVLNPQLLVSLKINNQTKDLTVSLGDTLEYVIKYQNASQTEIDDLKIKVKIDGDLVDWDTLADPNNGQKYDSTIEWTRSSLSNLSEVKPNDEGELKFSVKLKNKLPESVDSSQGVSLISVVEAESNKVVDLDNGSISVQSDPIEIKINSEFRLRAEGRYYSDEYLKVGSGPVPPQVGKETTYVVYWYLDNGINEVNNVSVSAILPEGITWKNDFNISAGNLSYDKDSRRVSWVINKLPKFVGQNLAEQEASFKVAVTPGGSDIGKIIVLLGKTLAKATDSFTDASLVSEADIITTDLATDPLASNKGLVKEESSVNTNTNSSGDNFNTNSNSTNSSNNKVNSSLLNR